MKEGQTLRHRGYLYAQGIFRVRDGRSTHPTIERMRLADAWRAGFLAATYEHQARALRSVQELEKIIRAGEKLLND